ncbi:transmembrane protein 154 isoform X2 [Syngnathus scovelli]|uniref:transmembrane protein 154 isoform X2 n=1 Tax=Syngnathus scovelli TaxID=161590 RepID=UPI00210FBF8C|nr:transmembrane protein 154 isoform X2 [Syngnathus scovelli]
MSAPRLSSTSMRDRHRNTPLFLLLLWLLTNTWTRTVSSQDEVIEEESQTVGIFTDQQVVEDTKTFEPTLSSPNATPSSELSTTQGSVLDPASAPEELGSGVDSRVITDNVNLLDTTLSPRKAEGLSITIILIPVALVVFIIVSVMFALFLRRRFKMEAAVHESTKDDPYLDGSSTEKVPMPMFEEDVPSVLELEMEELDQWMIKDG